MSEQLEFHIPTFLRAFPIGILFWISFIICEECYTQGDLDYSFNSRDIGFGNGDGASNDVYAILHQNNGKIMIGGQFNSYNGNNRNHIARLYEDGKIDSTFNPGTGSNGPIYSITHQTNGKIIIGGDFTNYNGTSRNCIARLNEDGKLDTTFNPGTGSDSLIWTTIIQPDGKIIIGGEFTSYNGRNKNRIARLNADGTIDSTFKTDVGANDKVYITLLQPDGKIIVGGEFTSFNGTITKNLTRLNADGTIDNSFNSISGLFGAVKTVTLQPNGKIIIGGKFMFYNGISRNYIARLDADGTLDLSFEPNIAADYWVNTTAIQPDGKIIIGGLFHSFNGNPRNNIARLNVDGTLDTSFDSGQFLNGNVNNLVLLPDGKLIISGEFFYYNKRGLARLKADGAIDNLFNLGSGADKDILTSALQPDGKILIGGLFNSFNGNPRNNIARLNVDGTLDTTFNPGSGANGFIYTNSVQPDGKIIIGGHFNFFNETPQNNISRLNPNGTLDSTFISGTGANNNIYITALQPDGKIVIGGWLTLYDRTNAIRIARLNVDGTLDFTFNSGTGANDLVHTVNVLPDGKILIGGRFTNYNGTDINRIARLNSNGAIDSTFNPSLGANKLIRIISIQPNGKIIVGGDFTNYNGSSRNYIVRLNTNGTLDTTFEAGLGSDDFIHTIAIQPDEKIIIGGKFKSYNGIDRNYIARLNNNGTIDNTFRPGLGTNGVIYSTVIQPDGKIIISGVFTSYNGIGRNRIARILNCDIAKGEDVQTACKSFKWIDGNTYTTSNNTATYNIIGGALNGCDSLITLNLTTYNLDKSVTVFGNLLSSNAIGVKYQWLNCDNGNTAISGATLQTYMPLETGNYSVVVTYNNCSDTSLCYKILVTGIDKKNLENSLIIYPIPVSNTLYIHDIRNAFNSSVFIQITDMTGTSFFTHQYPNLFKEVKIPIQSLPSGIYVIKIIGTNGNHWLEKFIKF